MNTCILSDTYGLSSIHYADTRFSKYRQIGLSQHSIISGI